MVWNEYPATRPGQDVMAYVTHIRANEGCYLASYSKDRDVFLLTPNNFIAIAVTHYCELPPPPNDERK